MESILANTIAHIARELRWARTVDEDYGQLEALDNEQLDMYPLTFPAILIDLPGTDWTDTGDIAQRGTCEVRVRQQTASCSARKKEKPCTRCCRAIDHQARGR